MRTTSKKLASILSKATLGLAVAGTLTGCWGNRSEHAPVHIFWNMDFQERWDAQEVTPEHQDNHPLYSPEKSIFADGRAMRPPVEGTVARGQLKDDDLLYRGRGFDGRFSDELPESIEADAALLARGEERYNIYCAPCHDMSGQGKGPVTSRGGGFKVVPANLHQERLRPMPLGYFYDIITNGKMPNMLPYAAQIPVEDRWAIAVWVRALQVHGQEQNPKWGAEAVVAAAAPAPAEGGDAKKEAN